jgi:LPXTG-motif cell wall-anchored protein
LTPPTQKPKRLFYTIGDWDVCEQIAKNTDRKEVLLMILKKQSKKAIAMMMIVVLMMSNVLPVFSLESGVIASTIEGITTSTHATSFVKDGGSVPVDPDLIINITTTTELDKATVVINNLKSGDTLDFTDQNGITGTYNSTSGVLTLSGSSSIDNYQTALQSVSFQTIATDLETRNITFTIGNALYFEPTQHFYEYVSTGSAITWEEARIEAEGRQLYGRQGYLATITSSVENQFILDKALGLGWVGARDINRNVLDGSFITGDLEQGDWRWVTGPEGLADGGNGLKFYSGYSGHGGTTVKSEENDEMRYTNWLSGEPNNNGGEWVVHIFGPSGTWWDDTGQGQWNDFANEVEQVKGYIVEYGGLPDDEVNNIEITASKDVKVFEETPITIAPQDNDIIANATDDEVVVSNVPNNTTVNLYKSDTLLETKTDVSGTVTFTGVSLEKGEAVQVTFTVSGKSESNKIEKLAQVRSTQLNEADITVNTTTNTVVVNHVPANAVINVYNSATGEIIGHQTNSSSVGTVTVTTTSLTGINPIDVTITKEGELESIKTSKLTIPLCGYSGPRAVFGGRNGTELFLGGNYIELGISNWGDFGTLGIKPDNFRGTLNGETSPSQGSNQIGMSADHDGFCNGRDLPVDYYLPGSPEERFAVGYKIGSAVDSRSNSAQMNVKQMPTTVHNESNTERGSLKARTVSMWNDTMEITQVISFNVEDKFYRNDVTINNISTNSWDGARYMRTFDPDNSQYRGGPYATANTVTHTIDEDRKAVVKAETYLDNDPLYIAFGSRIPIFFYSNDPAARASAFGFSNNNPYASAAYDNPSAKGTTLTADIAITMTWDSGPLDAGESKTFTYYTSLDERDFDDVQEEIFIDDVKTDIDSLKDMDDVKKVKTKIDDDDVLDEEKKKKLRSELIDTVYDEEKIDDILIRDGSDIITIREIINESDKSDEEKDDLRVKTAKKIANDLEELTPEDEEETRKIIADIVDSSKKEAAEDIITEKKTGETGLEDAIEAGEDVLEEAKEVQNRYKTSGGEETDELYKAVEEAKEALEEALATEPQEKEAIETATKALKEAVKALEEASEEKELGNAKLGAEEAKEASEKAKERYTNAGGEETDEAYKAVEEAKVALEEVSAVEPQITEAIEEATKVLKEAVKVLEEASEEKELGNAKADAEEIKEAAEATKERYTNAGGEETDELYTAVEKAKEALEETLAEEPQEKESIESATKAVKAAVKALEEASEAKEIENAEEAAEEAKEVAEKAQNRYKASGGEETDELYKAVEEAKVLLEETLAAEPQETEEIEKAIVELDKAVNLLEKTSTVNELENEIVQMSSIKQAIIIKKSIEDGNLSGSVKSKLYSMIIDQMIDSKNDFTFTSANQVLEVIDTIEKSDKLEADKQHAYIVLTEKAIDHISKGDKPTNERSYQESENQAIVVGIEKVIDEEEKQSLTTLLELTIDIRSLTMQTAFTFAENDTWESITLPFIMLATGGYGSAITWESSKETVINISGSDATVTRKAKDESVILTATALNDNDSIEKTFLLVVKSELLGDKVIEAVKREVTIETGTKLTKPPVIQRINMLDNTNSSVVNKIDKLIIDDTIISKETNEPVIIYLPDDKDNLADELAIEISLNVIEKLQDSLTIKTDQGSIVLSKETLEKMKQDGKDLFFRIVPVKKLDEKNEVIERTRTHELVIAELQIDQEVKVLGTPREIETNYKGYETNIILPLDDVEYSNSENLRIFIEHTDGDRKVLSGELVFDENDNPIGLQFTIDKFSTFTIFEIVSNVGSETPEEEPLPEDETETPDEGPLPEDETETSDEGPLPGEEPETPGKGSTPVVENVISDNTEELSEEEILEQEQDKEEKHSNELPKTATSNYNMILLGFALSIIGVLVLMVLSKRKKRLIE